MNWNVKSEILQIVNQKSYHDSKYWDGEVSIFNVQNKVLRECIGVDPVIIFSIFFCSWKIFLLSDELPKDIILYSIIEWQSAK